MKKIIALILVVVSLFSVISISAYAKNTAEDTVIVKVNETDFIFNANTSDEFRSKAISYHFNHNDNGATTYGLTCTLFGHKLESSLVKTITHKVKANSPRCLQETYDTEACTRCDYANATLIDSSYIVCC